MVGCAKCAGFAERINFATPSQYRDIVHQLLEIVDQGTFVLMEASCPLRDVLGPVWPDDVLAHSFWCTGCGRVFDLRADTYHGGASWKPR
jgi:hypothetical protein